MARDSPSPPLYRSYGRASPARADLAGSQGHTFRVSALLMVIACAALSCLVGHQLHGPPAFMPGHACTGQAVHMACVSNCRAIVASIRSPPMHFRSRPKHA